MFLWKKNPKICIRLSVLEMAASVSQGFEIVEITRKLSQTLSIPLASTWPLMLQFWDSNKKLIIEKGKLMKDERGLGSY